MGISVGIATKTCDEAILFVDCCALSQKFMADSMPRPPTVHYRVFNSGFVFWVLASTHVIILLGEDEFYLPVWDFPILIHDP